MSYGRIARASRVLMSSPINVSWPRCLNTRDLDLVKWQTCGKNEEMSGVFDRKIGHLNCILIEPVIYNRR